MKRTPWVNNEYEYTTAGQRRQATNAGRVAVIGVLVAAVLLVAWVVSAFLGGGDTEGGAATGQPAVAGEPALPEQDPRGQRTREDADWLTGAPAGLVWHSVGGLALPFGSADGPRDIDAEAGTAKGYSQTPQGAALAAYQIGSRIALGPSAALAAVVDEQTVFDAAASADVKANRGDPEPAALDGTSHPSAFKVLAFLPSQATVQYAMPNPMNGSYNSYQFTVVWVDGDWKLVAPNDTASAKALPGIDGFTPF